LGFLFVQGLDGEAGVEKDPIAQLAMGNQHRADLDAIAVEIGDGIGAMARDELGWNG
jgi:hypothetical protein